MQKEPENPNSYDQIKHLKLTELANTKVADIDIINSPIDDIVKEAESANDSIQDIINNLPELICKPGTICHNNKTKNDLKEKYYLAKETAISAPENLRQAKKNYFVFLEGNEGWNKIERAKYEKKAIAEKQLIEKTHNNKIKQLQSEIKLYSNTLDYHRELEISVMQNMKRYNKNMKQSTNIKDKNSLNKRKISYEVEQNNTMIMWKNIMLTAYIIIVLMYTYLFFRKNLWKAGGYRNNYIDITLLIFFYIWPFIALPITKLIFIIIHFIFNWRIS